MPKVRSFTILPALPDSLRDLEAVAANMYWSWNTDAIDLFRRIDSNLWSACGHNPVKLLGSVSQNRLEQLANNSGFLAELRRVVRAFSPNIRIRQGEDGCPSVPRVNGRVKTGQ